MSGGAAHYFAEELNDLFAKIFEVPLHWCEDLHQEFRTRFGLQEAEKSLMHWFADPYVYARSRQERMGETVPVVNGQAGDAHG